MKHVFDIAFLKIDVVLTMYTKLISLLLAVPAIYTKDTETKDVEKSASEEENVTEGQTQTKPAFNKDFICVSCTETEGDSTTGNNNCCDCCCEDKNPCTGGGGKPDPEIPCECLDNKGNFKPDRKYK